MPKITFLPSNIAIDTDGAECLRSAGVRAGVVIASTCGGVGSCGLCKVKITTGVDQLSPMTTLEVGKLGNVFFITKERLSCQAIATGDVSCEVPDDAADRLRREQKARETQRQRNIDRIKAKAQR